MVVDVSLRRENIIRDLRSHIGKNDQRQDAEDDLDDVAHHGDGSVLQDVSVLDFEAAHAQGE